MTNFKWPKNLIVVRHGESESNVALDLLQPNLDQILIDQQKKTRDADVKLTDRGILQAKQAGIYLAKEEEPFHVCFSSPYERAIQTAHHIIFQLGYKVPIYVDNRLREKEFGKLHGLTTSEIKEKFPEEFLDRQRDGKYWYRLPRGENYPDVEMRVHSFLDKLARNYQGRNVLVTTHQVPYKLFRALFEHLGEEEVLSLKETPNCGIQKFVSENGKLKLKYFNFVAKSN